MATTTAISGHGGSITSASGGTEITEWNTTVTTEALEATSMGSAGSREFIRGLTGCTGSFSCIGVVPGVGADSTLLLKTGAGGHSVTGADAAIITSSGISNPLDGPVEYSADFTMSGAITVAAVS